jgi:hypothetical protein
VRLVPAPWRGAVLAEFLAGAARSARLQELAALTYAPTEHGCFRSVLARSGDVELVAIRWPRGTTCALHGHGASAARLEILAGHLVEDQFVDTPAGFLYQQPTLRPGATSFAPPGSFHRVSALEDTVALHAFAPVPVAPAQDPTPVQLRELASAWRMAQPPRRRRVHLPSWLRPQESP